MTSSATSSADTFTYFDVYQQNRAEEPERTLNFAQWCPRMGNKLPLYQDLGNSEEQWASLHAQFLKYVVWASFTEDLSKALGNIKTVSNYWKTFHTFAFTEEEKSISTSKEVTEIEFEIPERKRITWRQAHTLAFISLRDAEERRRHFAEEEAKRTAVWEEWD